MREKILKRIDDIKSLEQDFRKGTMRWDNFKTGTLDKHISDVNFRNLPDTMLVDIFERIIKRYYTQM